MKSLTVLFSAIVFLTSLSFSPVRAQPSDFFIEGIAGGRAPWMEISYLIIDSTGFGRYFIMRADHRGDGEYDSIASFNLSPGQMAAIYDSVVSHDFFNLDTLYDGDRNDGSFLELFIRAGGTEKRVKSMNIEVPALDSLVRDINAETPDTMDLIYNELNPSPAPNRPFPSYRKNYSPFSLPGFGTTVTRDLCRITVTINIDLVGLDASEARATAIKNSIEAKWNQSGQWFGWCPVVFVANVSVGTQKAANHQITLDPDDDFRSYVNNPLPGVNGAGGTGRWEKDAGDDNTAAHECGHLMGLADQYKDSTYTDAAGKRHVVSIPLPGHDNDCMASLQKGANPAIPLQSAIDQIVNAAGITCPEMCCIFDLIPVPPMVCTVGAPNCTITLTASNQDTTAPLQIQLFSISDPAFQVSPPTAFLPPLGTQPFTVIFQPPAPGPYQGYIVFVHQFGSLELPPVFDTIPVAGFASAPVDSQKFLSLPPETLTIANVGGKFQKRVKRGKGLYPNWANLRDETIAQGGFAPGTSESDSAGGIRVGISFMERRNPGDPAKPNWKPIKDSAAVYGWIRIGKWNFKKSIGASPDAIPKTLRSKGTLFHTGQPRGLDSTGNPGEMKRKKFVKEHKKLEPKKTSNKLFAELLALKLNIAISALGKTPAGFGDLIFDRDGNFLDEMSIMQISRKADTMMTRWPFYSTVDYDSLWQTIYDINRAFAGPLDTISFETTDTIFTEGKLIVEGQVEIGDIPFLHLPVPFVPTRIAPSSTITEPDEDFADDDDEALDGLPVAAELYQNYPNPFNPSTTISFRLKEVSLVTITVYDLLGREVGILAEREEMDEGLQSLEFSADGLASGVYFYRIDVRGIAETGLKTFETRKMMLVK